MLMFIHSSPGFVNAQCLCLQIGSLSVGPEADAQFVQLYVIFMNQLVTILPVTADIPKAYEQGSDDEQEFVQNLAIFLTGFLKVMHVCYTDGMLAPKS